MGEFSFDHRCEPNDIAIARHTNTVRDVLRSTTLLETIQRAHGYQGDSTEKAKPMHIGPNLFLDAEGQDESDDESTRTDSESQHSSESEDGHEEQDRSEHDCSEHSGDDSSPPLTPTDDDEWE